MMPWITGSRSVPAEPETWAVRLGAIDPFGDAKSTTKSRRSPSKVRPTRVCCATSMPSCGDDEIGPAHPVCEGESARPSVTALLGVPDRRRCCRGSPVQSGSRSARRCPCPSCRAARSTGSAVARRPPRVLEVAYARARCIRPKPRGPSSWKFEICSATGFASGRHIHSPAPVSICRPSESWTAGRKSSNPAAVRRIEHEHRCLRRETDLRDLLARIDLGLHVDQRLGAAADDEAIGAGRGGAVEQRVDDQRHGVGLRLLEPEFAEDGKLLALGAGGVDRRGRGRTARSSVLSRRRENRWRPGTPGTRPNSPAC